jgi:hypothetical protein
MRDNEIRHSLLSLRGFGEAARTQGGRGTMAAALATWMSQNLSRGGDTLVAYNFGKCLLFEFTPHMFDF